MRTLRDARGLATLEQYFLWVREHAARYGKPFHLIPVPSSSTIATEDEVAPLVAFASGGDWVAACDAPGCGEATVVEPGWPVMCAKCCHVLWGYRWRLVAWPTERARIDALLDERPMSEHRNWHPLRDSIESLEAENKDRPWLAPPVDPILAALKDAGLWAAELGPLGDEIARKES